jgi:hypothetical protein
MSLYPSLEDMTVGKMAKAQVQAHPQPAIANGSTGPSAPPPPSGPSAPPPAAAASPYAGLYPNLHDEYMGLNLVPFRTPVSVRVNPFPTSVYY